MQTPSQMQTPLDADPSWMQTPLDADPPPDADPLDADPPGHVTCDTCWEANPNPPPDRRHDICL